MDTRPITVSGSTFNFNRQNINPPINIGQINLHTSKVATATINKIAEELKLDILLVQEPYTFKNKTVGFPLKYKIAEVNYNNKRPKSCIVILNAQINCQFIKEHSSENIAVVNVLTTDNSPIIIISAYTEPQSDLELFLDTLQVKLSVLNSNKCIIAMDSNSHSVAWGGDKTDRRGRTLERWIGGNDLFLLNDGQIPTFNNDRHATFIDITLAGGNILPRVGGWVTRDTFTGSDHALITFTVDSPELRRSGGGTRIYSSIRIDKTPFITRVGDLFADKNINIARCGGANTSVSVNTIVSEFMWCITTSCSRYLAKGKNVKNKSYNPWWTKELTGLRNHVQAARRRFQRTREPVLRNYRTALYKKVNNKYKREIEKAKTRSWRAFCTLNYKNPFAEAYKLCRNEFRRAQMREPLLDCNGRPFNNVQDECLHLLQHHIGTDDNTDLEGLIVCDTSVDVPLTRSELDRFFKFLPDKAPGPDGFDRKITQSLYNNYTDLVFAIYKACFRTCTFPTVWKKAHVILIPKPDKVRYDTPEKFRPISLISTFGKILEKVIKARLMHHLQINNLLSRNQFGFLQNRSTAQASEALVEAASSAMANSGYCLAVTLDIRGAFDNVRWPMIIETLNKKSVPHNIKQLISNYLADRSATLTWQGSTASRQLRKGCPQGSVLSPYLWLLVVEALLEKKFEAGIRVVAYADDILVIGRGNDLTILNEKVNETLVTVYNWSRDQSLNFSYAKCSCILFTRRKKYTTPVVTMGGQIVPLKDSFRYLGLVIDNRLTWNKHVKLTCQKAMKFLHMFRRISRNTWGAGPKTVKIIYHAALRPMITYNCQVWASALNKKYNVKILRQTERQIAITILKAYTDISYNAAVSLAGIVPLELEINRIAEISFALNLGTFKIKNVDYEIDGKVPWVKSLHPSIGPPIWVNPDITTPLMPPLNITEIDPHKSQINCHRTLNNAQINFDNVAYTDGSKTPDGVGSGYVIHSEGSIRERKFKLSKHCNIFQAELFAILQVLYALYDYDSAEHTVLIITDSLSSIYAMIGYDGRHSLVRKILRLVDKLGRRNCQVYVEWTKSHSGNAGNDRVDQLAKMATTMTKAKSYTMVPTNFVKSTINNLYKVKCAEWYDRLDASIRIKKLFPSFVQLRQFVSCHDIGFIETQLITGHGHFAAHLHRRHVVESPSCECDDESDQTAEHLLLDCPNYLQNRLPLIRDLSKDRIELSLPAVLSSRHSGRAIKIFREISQCMIELQSQSQSP